MNLKNQHIQLAKMDNKLLLHLVSRSTIFKSPRELFATLPDYGRQMGPIVWGAICYIFRKKAKQNAR